MLRVEVGARALRNQTGGGGGRVQRPVGALARVCVSGPQNRKRSQEGINPPSELSRSLSRHNHGAAGGGHPIIELPCILYQTPRTLIRERFFTGMGPVTLYNYSSHAARAAGAPLEAHPAPNRAGRPCRALLRARCLSLGLLGAWCLVLVGAWRCLVLCAWSLALGALC